MSFDVAIWIAIVAVGIFYWIVDKKLKK